ncbi:protein-glutamine gamma-glutamyltransferase [Bacillus benzoevorans]|uniref:Protein-glutamine gamma-glutamyltransferase n=1 Tax=Bacillus benzoevorans TaxID=1456 RepID=A0A7X0LV96_9BACI|nr:protein-glutamine gamma-glutamyltransferase [Bacillus benzoevorans]MBB6445300.1 protein-glutamine gamma-glutamyltransferase [Bacillus benzoevorans]
MIQLLGRPFSSSDVWPVGSVERKIVQGMIDDPIVYPYRTIEELRFELKLRKNIIASSRAMNQSDVDFEIFSTARCNPNFWILTGAGGFLLRDDVYPSEAILDIYKNSSLYGFECATAKVILLYHAVLTTIGKTLFNRYFQNLYLYSWHNDPDLGLKPIPTSHFLPGDIVYFNNPEVDPSTIWWRGENAVLLEDGKFFGHGLGIMTSQEIINYLNKMRKPGSNISAYMLNSAARPSYSHLANITKFTQRDTSNKMPYFVMHHNKNSISLERYQRYLNTAMMQQNNIHPSPFLL